MGNEYVYYMDSPVGFLKIVTSEDCLFVCDFRSEKGDDENYGGYVPTVVQQLQEYFDGKRKKFDLNLFFNGTGFQKEVWNQLLDIPYGETVSYKYIAEKINNPKAVRAVGGANGNNSIVIIAPCHRVIGSDGTLTGFGGGLDNKKWLLDHEKKVLESAV